MDTEKYFGRGEAVVASEETLDALNLLTKERFRQIIQENYTPALDDEHIEGQLALLAAAYTLLSLPNLKPDWGRYVVLNLKEIYGLEVKPKDPIHNLKVAGALILAELERRLRAENSAREKED